MNWGISFDPTVWMIRATSVPITRLYCWDGGVHIYFGHMPVSSNWRDLAHSRTSIECPIIFSFLMYRDCLGLLQLTIHQINKCSINISLNIIVCHAESFTSMHVHTAIEILQKLYSCHKQQLQKCWPQCTVMHCSSAFHEKMSSSHQFIHVYIMKLYNLLCSVSDWW